VDNLEEDIIVEEDIARDIPSEGIVDIEEEELVDIHYVEVDRQSLQLVALAFYHYT